VGSRAQCRRDGHRLIDVLIHGWDLAIAAGQDAALDDLVEACRQIAGPQISMLRASGAFAEGRPAPPDAGAQARLQAMLGRSG
jgi:hypothetical protein